MSDWAYSEDVGLTGEVKKVGGGYGGVPSYGGPSGGGGSLKGGKDEDASGRG